MLVQQRLRRYWKYTESPRFVSWLRREASASGARMGNENGWSHGGRKVVKETAEIAAHPTAAGHHAFDVALALEVVDAPVELAGTSDLGKGYGGCLPKQRGRTARAPPRRPRAGSRSRNTALSPGAGTFRRALPATARADRAGSTPETSRRISSAQRGPLACRRNVSEGTSRGSRAVARAAPTSTAAIRSGRRPPSAQAGVRVRHAFLLAAQPQFEPAAGAAGGVSGFRVAVFVAGVAQKDGGADG